MNENNIFNNEDENVQNPIVGADSEATNPTENDSSNFSDNYNFDETETEIELDPELNMSDTKSTEEQVIYNSDSQMTSNFNAEQIEPIPPIMPQIEKNEYKPMGHSASGKGIKVFATVIALLVVISACVTGGYYFGKSTNPTNKTTFVDLASKPTPDNALTVSQIYNEISPSVVGIYVYNSEKGTIATATGVIYSKDGYIVTNDHIYDGIAAAKFKVYTHDKKMYSATYVAGDTRSDLAVLKITDAKEAKFTPAKFGNSDEAVVGESVVAIGRPNGATNPSVASEGIISVVSTRVTTTSNYTSSLIQTDTAINPGNSGGALCNIYGQVIGITSAKLVGDEYDSIGYAIPTTTVKKIADSLIKHKTVVNRAKLGISYQHIDELSAELLKLPCGLQIAEIDKSCGLYGKSVEIKDIITHVNGTEIIDSNIILDVIDASAPGDVLDLKIYSVNKKKSIDIKVKLLKDVGSSSYVAEDIDDNNNNNNDNDNNDKNKQEYNSSEFNFPFGE